MKCMILWVALALPAPAATLVWPQDMDPKVAGYRAYMGTNSRVYSAVMDVGPALQAEIPPMTPGVTYFFAVTAYTAEGNESPFSDEANYTAPYYPQPPVALFLTGTNSLRIMSSIDLNVWTSVTNIVLPASTNGMQFFRGDY
jgi:hypothetical protein